MSRKKLAWANKEVETFVCILGEEDVVYDVYVAAAAIDIRPTTKGTVGSGNATSELSWANRSLPTAPLRSDPFRTLQWKCGIMEENWHSYSPAILLFLISIIPSIWILELHHHQNISIEPQCNRLDSWAALRDSFNGQNVTSQNITSINVS
ncbi:unnamed protein product [Boreogadus saida]